MGAEEIVLALAGMDPIEHGDDQHWCVICGAYVPICLDDHDPDCPWRLAVEHVASLEAECNTCGGSGRWETTLEDAPTVLVDLGPCPDCGPKPEVS